MFKKLVTNLPYSPGLLNQIGFYSKRLRQEEFVRRLGIIFTILAMMININVLYFGPESSVLASPANDVVVGGIYGSTASQIQDKTIAAMRSSSVTKAIFDYYGITEADIRGTSLTTLNTKDESLRSVGRQSFGRGGEVCRTHQGVYFCERSMYAAYSYQNLNVRAIAGMRSGSVGSNDPWFALIESCGNVVIRTGTQEDIAVSKQVNNNVQTAEVGDEVTFRVRISALNGNGATNPVIRDTIPQHMEYVRHFPNDVYDRSSVSGGVLTLSSSRDRYEIGPNSSWGIDITFRILSTAPAGAKLCNSVQVTSLGDTALTTSEPCVSVAEVQPEPSCLALRTLSGSGSDLTRSFEAEVNANGATVDRYVFSWGDGTTETVNSSANRVDLSHTYAQAGSYQVSVLIYTSAGVVGGSGGCQKSILIEEPQAEQEVVFRCDYLNLVSREGRSFSFEAGGSSEGTTISLFDFDFGDGATSQVAVDNNKATAEHTYTQAGDYQVRATAVDVNGLRSTGPSCMVSITVEPEPIVCPYNNELASDDPLCQQQEAGEPDIIMRKYARNVTQNIDDAHNTTARAGDVIEYRLETENDGTATYPDYEIKETFGDVLQYADVIDLDGGSLNEESFILSWPKVDIAAGESLTKTVTVRIKSPIPETPISVSDSAAYDLMMENVYGNNVTVKLPSTPGKTVEEVTRELPNTGPGLNAAVSTVFFGTVAYFYTRNRLISKELGMIKKEFSGAGL